MPDIHLASPVYLSFFFVVVLYFVGCFVFRLLWPRRLHRSRRTKLRSFGSSRNHWMLHLHFFFSVFGTLSFQIKLLALSSHSQKVASSIPRLVASVWSLILVLSSQRTITSPLSVVKKRKWASYNDIPSISDIRSLEPWVLSFFFSFGVYIAGALMYVITSYPVVQRTMARSQMWVIVLLSFAPSLQAGSRI